MDIYSQIKKIVSLSLEKKKSTYLRGDIFQRSISTKNGQLGTVNTKILTLRRLLKRKNIFEQNNYSSRMKSTGSLKIGRVVVSATVILLIFVCGGRDYALKKLQEIEYFKVTELSITGGSVLSEKELRVMAGIIAHQTSLLGMDTEKIEAKMQADPWIANAMVQRNWPSGVDIEVEENIPLALLLTKTTKGTELHYIDKKGHTFILLAPGGNIDYPVVTGLSEIEDELLRGAALKEVLIFLNKARRNDPHLPIQSLSEVHVTKEGGLVVYLVDYPFPIFFGNGNTKQKYGRLVEVLKALYKKEKGKDLISAVEYIQMDYLQDKVLVAQDGQG
ncbi:MAG: hypothetical protein COA36_00425 [Desulfotalea sp.]|nr:MAG: hypothetical protein COA36_00425 [Desulfotalea sp.]